MFYYEPEEPPRVAPSRSEIVLFLLVALCWLIPGLVGHEPWKPDEAYNFGLIRCMIESGNWTLFHLPGEPPVLRDPLYYWVAALFAKLLSPLFSFPDAARLATGFFMSATLLFLGLAARELYGNGRIAVLILIGSFGLLAHAHQMVPQSALLAGTALALYGLALWQKPFCGAVFATGAGVAFLAGGFTPLFFLLPLLPIVGLRSAFRARTYALSAAALAPWLFIWPVILSNAAPQLFHAWLESAFSPKLDEPFFFTAILPWFAWPTLPLALWTLWREGLESFRKPVIFLPLAAFLLMLLVLTVFSPPREVHALPILLPLALLASAAIDSLKRSLVSAFNWFGYVTFGLLAGFFWLGWLAMVFDFPKFLAAKVHHYHPDFHASFQFLPFLTATAATLIWLTLLARRGREPSRAVLNWACGIAMIWMILMTTWLPFLDSVKSYREPFSELAAFLPRDHGCISGRNLGDAQRAMLDYYAHIRTQREADCRLLLVETLASDRKHPEGWSKIWEGARPGDRFERYRLYRKD